MTPLADKEKSVLNALESTGYDLKRFSEKDTASLIRKGLECLLRAEKVKAALYNETIGQGYYADPSVAQKYINYMNTIPKLFMDLN